MADPNGSTSVKAIMEASTSFRHAMPPSILDSITFVPIPPSKAKGHPLYDDRLTQMLHEIRPQPTLDVREIIMQDTSTDPAHDTEDRPSPDDIAAMYKIDETLTTPEPSLVAVVDDVLTTGAHYRAAHTKLSARFPGAAFIGLFVARRAPQTTDVEEFL